MDHKHPVLPFGRSSTNGVLSPTMSERLEGGDARRKYKPLQKMCGSVPRYAVALEVALLEEKW
jgi:hypothetical protein